MNVRWLARAGAVALCALLGSSGFAVAADAALPEGRVYELVSPPDKNGAAVLNTTTQTAIGGGAVAFGSEGAFGGVQGAMATNAYVATRGTTGWSTVGIQPPIESGGELFPPLTGVRYLSADFSKQVVETQEPALVPGAPVEVPNLYVRDNATGSYELVTIHTPSPVPGNYGFSLAFADASADLSHVIFQAAGKLTPDASEAVNLYEWANGHLRLISTPVPAAGGTVAGDGAGTGDGNLGSHTQHSISDDGSRVFFSTGNEEGPLYMKEGNATIHVSASQSSTPEGEGEKGRFMTAMSDGSKVLFVSANRLTDNANASAGPFFTYGDLYLYDMASGKLTDLTGNSPDPTGANVGEVLATSEDLSYVYFNAAGQLIPGKGTSGAANLYLWHDGQIAYIGELNRFNQIKGYALTGSGGITPDGTKFVFTSEHKLTSFENEGVQEVYVYDANTGQIVCASCVPGALGGVGLAGGDQPRGLGATFHHDYSRSISADGTVYFTSQDALVPRDHNGKQDVYQWRDGVVSLISTGQSADNSYLGDVSLDGTDVFFYTSEGLVPEDWDGIQDLYDARLDGGFSAALETSCSGDTCKAPSLSPPAPVSPSSAAFSGSGNANPAVSAPVVKSKPKAKPKAKAKHRVKKKHRKVKKRKRAKKSVAHKGLSAGSRR
ncbi:MAG TPA: hypothetical protein VGI76_00830 [Solirubrobacteraceae bacterium]|jgi:Tol biopolymer transport system component